MLMPPLALSRARVGRRSPLDQPRLVAARMEVQGAAVVERDAVDEEVDDTLVTHRALFRSIGEAGQPADRRLTRQLTAAQSLPGPVTRVRPGSLVRLRRGHGVSPQPRRNNSSAIHL